jgi:hypothetical protein
LRDADVLLEHLGPLFPNLNHTVRTSCHILDLLDVLGTLAVRLLLAGGVGQVLRVQHNDGSDVLGVAKLVLAGWWVSVVVALLIVEVLFFHGVEGLVLKEHIVHELVPLHGAVRVSVNAHEQLVKLLGTHVLLANNATEGFNELHNNNVAVTVVYLPPIGQGSLLYQCLRFRTAHATP